jgi:hypothetical protein
LAWLVFSGGEGCEKDLDKAKENFLLASELGSVSAMIGLENCLTKMRSDGVGGAGQQRLAPAANFLANFVEQVELFNSGAGSAAVMFAIGRALQGTFE